MLGARYPANCSWPLVIPLSPAARSKEMDRLSMASGFSAIQNNSDLSQGLKPANGCTVERKGDRHLDAAFEEKEADIELQQPPA